MHWGYSLYLSSTALPLNLPPRALLHFKMPSLSWSQKFFTPEMRSSLTAYGAAHMFGHWDTINELKVYVHCTYGGKDSLCHLLGQNMPAMKMEKRCPETESYKVHCDKKDFQCCQRWYRFSKDLFHFPFIAVSCGDNISWGMMLLLFHHISFPLTPPPLL